MTPSDRIDPLIKLRRVQCGWCPMMLPDDHDEQRHHFLVAHRITGVTSVRYIYGHADWDTRELTDAE